MYGSTTGSAGSSTTSSSNAVSGLASSKSANQLYLSHSNPDLTSMCYEDPRADYPEHVLKVFKADQTCKYLLVHKVLFTSFLHWFLSDIDLRVIF